MEQLQHLLKEGGAGGGRTTREPPLGLDHDFTIVYQHGKK
jgi:hypothetical protein